MSDQIEPNGQVFVEQLGSQLPEMPKEIPLVPSQLLLIAELSAQAQGASDAVEAAISVARAKQAGLDQAIKMVMQLANVEDVGYQYLLDRQHSTLKLVPQRGLSR